MTTKKGNMTCNDFYCLACGKKSVTAFRKDSRKRGKFHRKKLYCFSCKKTLNFIEIKDEAERIEFLERFNNGEYAKEAKESVDRVDDDKIFQDFMDKGVL